MGGKNYNAAMLTQEYVTAAVAVGKTSREMAIETGVSQRTVFNYMSKYRIFFTTGEPGRAQLKRLQAEAAVLEEKLQKTVFSIDLLRMKIKRAEQESMAALTELAKKVRARR